MCLTLKIFLNLLVIIPLEFPCMSITWSWHVVPQLVSQIFHIPSLYLVYFHIKKSYSLKQKSEANLADFL